MFKSQAETGIPSGNWLIQTLQRIKGISEINPKIKYLGMDLNVNLFKTKSKRIGKSIRPIKGLTKSAMAKKIADKNMFFLKKRMVNNMVKTPRDSGRIARE